MSAVDGIRRMRSRFRAAERLPPLDCGCADPLPCRCTLPPLTERAVDGYRDAAAHILAAGNTPAIPFEHLRALYRRGGADRALAEELHERAGGSIQ